MEILDNSSIRTSKSLEDTKSNGLSEQEKKEIFMALKLEMRGPGHYYCCENGHTYTVGNCGTALEVYDCYECGAAIGNAKGTYLNSEFEGFGIDFPYDPK